MSDLRAYQPSFTAGELSPALGARVDLAKYATGMRVAINVFVHPHGGVSNRSGLQFIGAAKNGDNPAWKPRLIKFQFNTEQTYVLEFGENYMRFYRGGSLILNPDGTPYEIATGYPAASLGQLVCSQEADVMYITHVNHPIRKLGRYGERDWRISDVTFAPSQQPPATVTASVKNSTSGKSGYQATQYRYAVSAIADSGEESLPTTSGVIVNDLSIAGGINTVSWTAVTGAVRYVVYKNDNGVYGYIGGTEGLSFDDENIVADLSDTPQQARNPFSGAGNWPRCVTFVEQRLAFAGTVNDPQAVWLSQSGNYENFGTSRPAKASDAVTFRIRARQVNEIRSMIPARGLLLLTSGSEWVVTGGNNSDAISPSALKLDNQGYRGTSRLQPIVVGNTVLFPQRQGGVIRDFSYEFAEDGYVGKDLTILARHLFEGKEIVAWDYAQAPYSMVWAVLDDHSLVSLTYMKEQDVWAWTRHESLGAQFEDVTVIEENGEDVPYFIVRRTLGGVQRRYIERLHTRNFQRVEDAFFVDSGLSYSGAPVKVISGLGHLEGESVVALADGNVISNLKVAGGSVTLPVAASKVHVGLGVTATVQTLSLDLGQVQGLGSVQGRMKSVSEVVFRVEKTRGIFVGPKDGDRNSDWLVEPKQRQDEAWGEAMALRTDDVHVTPAWDWNETGAIWVKQFDPLPMTILAIMPDISLGK